MRTLKLFFVLFIVFGFAENLSAQKGRVVPIEKFKAPKLYTVLGNYKDSAYVDTTEAINLVSMPLKIYDDKKNEYKISTYQFLYRKRGVTEDEKTGALSPITSVASDLFRETPLSPIWINVIHDEIKSKEELYFFDVIVKDAKGRVMYAPSLKLIIK